MNIFRIRAPAALALIPCVLLAACQADYAADLTNHTPQPLSAQIFRKSGDKAVLGMYRRLGPGDRTYLGPVRTDTGHGAFLSVDTFGNPGRPVTIDLPPGASFFEIFRDGPSPDSPLRLVQKH